MEPSMDTESTREDRIIAAYANGDDLETIKARYGAERSEIEAIVTGGRHPSPAPKPYQAPVTPRYDQPGPLAAFEYNEPSIRHRRWPYVAGATAALALALVAAAVFALNRSGDTPPPTAFETAQRSCDPAKTGTTITDAGRTLLIDSTGDKDYTGADVTALSCLLRSLKAPDAVIAHMSATRALDGRQEDRWPGFTASWSYHPDQGMDVIVRTV
jgi:hypothetical protein